MFDYSFVSFVIMKMVSSRSGTHNIGEDVIKPFAGILEHL